VAPSSEDRHAFRPGKGLPPRLIADHLNGLRHQATSIEWGNLMMPAGVDTPRNQKMLQLTDTAGGALYAAFEWDDYGNTERRYLETLRSQLWRSAGRALQTHGLKVCPWPHPRHSWAQEFCRR